MDSHQLPDHWPRYTTAEYYGWMMRRMPEGAIVADWSRHKPHNSHSPIFWYADRPCRCVECDEQFIFTKEEQKHWYEDLKIPIYVRANRCFGCREKRRQDKAAQKK